MASIPKYIATVDRLMEAEKTLVGFDQPEWKPGRDQTTLSLKLPIEVGGELPPSTMFFIEANPHSRFMSFAMGLVVMYCVCRLDYGNEASHLNGVGKVRGQLAPIIYGPHYHPWAINKRFVTSLATAFNLGLAEPFDSDARNFDAILRWFCGTNRIVLPHNHRIALPDPFTLL